jgi:hypothetical protein
VRRGRRLAHDADTRVVLARTAFAAVIAPGRSAAPNLRAACSAPCRARSSGCSRAPAPSGIQRFAVVPEARDDVRSPATGEGRPEQQ